MLLRVFGVSSWFCHSLHSVLPSQDLELLAKCLLCFPPPSFLCEQGEAGVAAVCRQGWQPSRSWLWGAQVAAGAAAEVC